MGWYTGRQEIFFLTKGFPDDSARRKEMERVPSDDPASEAKGNGVLEHLCYSLQSLASPAQAQLNHFPVDWIVLTGEMVLDFDHWAQCLSTYWKPSPVQMVQL